MTTERLMSEHVARRAEAFVDAYRTWSINPTDDTLSDTSAQLCRLMLAVTARRAARERHERRMHRELS